MGMRKIQKGVTLIELMIVIVIIGVLTLIAFPSYNQHVVKSNRAAAQAYLMDLAQMEQQVFNDARIYVDNAAALDMEAPERVNDNYVVTFDLATSLPPSFTILASPRTGSQQAGDGVLSIDSSGEKLLGGEAW